MLVFRTCLCTYPNSGSRLRVGATIGAVLDSNKSCSILFDFRIAMADATAFLEFIIFSPDGEGERPAGDAIEVGTRKSSRFMGSEELVVECSVATWWIRWSLAFRN